MQRVGILGGTFDPIHYGHLAIAEEARWAVDLTRVYLVPAAHQPLKHGQHAATARQRMHMVRLACADNAAFVPSDFDLRRAPPSYTVDTLRRFQLMLGDAVELWFILGYDALMSLPQWHAAPQIIKLAKLAAIARPGFALDMAVLEGQLPGIVARTQVIDGPHLDISSTALRQRIATGQPIRYQLPDTVLEYIIQEQLYHRS